MLNLYKAPKDHTKKKAKEKEGKLQSSTYQEEFYIPQDGKYNLPEYTLTKSGEIYAIVS